MTHAEGRNPCGVLPSPFPACGVHACTTAKTDFSDHVPCDVRPFRSAVISAEQCIGGEGPGCEAAASESPIVRELLEKSRANRARHDKETLEEYWARGYGDYFSFGYNKELVKGEDGKWSLETPNDLRTQMENRLIDMIRKRKVASTGGSADQG